MRPRKHATAPEVILDIGRSDRTGLDEAVFCAGKSVDQIANLLRRIRTAERSILLTRCSVEQMRGLPTSLRRDLDYDPVSRTGFYRGVRQENVRGTVAVVAAGTSDLPVSREASRTLVYHGVTPLDITDVGVAGLWRLLDRIDDIRSTDVVIAVAGMDAALPTVLGGLIAAPIIGVPTSVGYGVAIGGTTALNAMLGSCASGLSVVNIDNGYGAACAAVRILRAMRRR